MSRQKITANQRSGGYATGVIDVTSTGVKTISGLDFAPKYVKFICGDNSSNRFQLSRGYMDADSQYVIGGLQGSAAGQVISAYSDERCIQGFSTPGGTPSIVCVGVKNSIDSNGFSVNITTSSSVPVVLWEAYG